MAVYNAVDVNGIDWVNINTVSGVGVGDAFNIQNVSMSDVYLVESSTTPSNSLRPPVLYNPTYGELSKASVESGSLVMWAKCVNKDSNALLAIYE